MRTKSTARPSKRAESSRNSFRTPSPPVTPLSRPRVHDSGYATGSVFVGSIPSPTITPNKREDLKIAALKNVEESTESDVLEAHTLIDCSKICFDQPVSISSISKSEVESCDKVYQDIEHPVTPKRGDQTSTFELDRIESLREKRHAGSQGLLRPEQPTSKNFEVASWVFQDEDSTSSSDSSSICSLESDGPGDEFEEEELVLREMETEAYAVFSGRQAALEELRVCAKGALDRLLRSIEVETLTVLETSLNSQLGIYRRAADNDIPPSSRYIHTGTDGTGVSGDARGLKRRQDDDDEEFPWDREDRNPNKKQKFGGGLSTTSRKMWACPYYKREPHRYCVVTGLGDFRKCAKSPGFSEVHRVKDHLKKCHSPKYCDRCYAVFKNEDDLTTHRRMSPVCEVKPPQHVEGLISKQKALLKSRDRSSDPEERWNTMYKICFPDDEVIPDPYYVHYSREVAELRREIMAIIDSEAQTPQNFDLNRMRQRMQQAFNTPLSTEIPRGSTPPRVGILTPSTSNTSGGRSSETRNREIHQMTPSVQRSSRTYAAAIDSGDTLHISAGIPMEDEPYPLEMGDDDSSVPFEMLHFHETGGFLGLEQPQSIGAIPFQGFDPVPQRNCDEHQLDVDHSLPNLGLSEEEINELLAP